MKWKETNGSLKVFLSGEIDHCAAERLREGLEKLIRKMAYKTMILDFSDVTFMDSSGVGMLIGRYKTMQAVGGCMYASGLKTPVERLYRMAGLHRIIPIVQEEGRVDA